MILTSGVSDAQLKLSYWYVTHKLLLRKVFVYLFIFINLNIWIFAIFFVLKVFVFDQETLAISVKQLGSTAVNYSRFNQSNQPLVPQLSDLKILSSGGAKNDLLMIVKNNNANWLGRFRGQFSIGDTEFLAEFFSILPQETKYVLKAGVDFGEKKGTPQFRFTNIQWQKIANKDLTDRFIKERSDFKISNKVYHSPFDLNLGGKAMVGGVSFDVENNSLFDYWSVNNQILFKRGGEVVAVNNLPVAEFLVGQFRHLDFRVFDGLNGITDVDVLPQVDIFDESNIMEEPVVVGEIK